MWWRENKDTRPKINRKNGGIVIGGHFSSAKEQKLWPKEFVYFIFYSINVFFFPLEHLQLHICLYPQPAPQPWAHVQLLYCHCLVVRANMALDVDSCQNSALAQSYIYKIKVHILKNWTKKLSLFWDTFLLQTFSPEGGHFAWFSLFIILQSQSNQDWSEANVYQIL